MKSISIVLLVAAIALLLLLATEPCTKDHYANQVVHAGVGGIAGPVVTIQNQQPLYSSRNDPLVDEDQACIIGR